MNAKPLEIFVSRLRTKRISLTWNGGARKEGDRVRAAQAQGEGVLRARGVSGWRLWAAAAVSHYLTEDLERVEE